VAADASGGPAPVDRRRGTPPLLIWAVGLDPMATVLCKHRAAAGPATGGGRTARGDAGR
jgi:hypothetical protein